MKKLTPAQLNLFAILEKSREKIQKLAHEAYLCNCIILGKELLAMDQQIKGAMDLQARAFRDDTLADPPLSLFPGTQKRDYPCCTD